MHQVHLFKISLVDQIEICLDCSIQIFSTRITHGSSSDTLCWIPGIAKNIEDVHGVEVIVRLKMVHRIRQNWPWL
jgi:hypothetical protein